MDQRAKFSRNNKLKAKSLLMNYPAERTFFMHGNNGLITIVPGNFINGEPTNHQIIMKTTSMWNKFDVAAKAAY